MRHLLLVHYTGGTNYPLRAGTVHDTFFAWEGQAWSRVFTDVADTYRLDLLKRL